ncbi:SPOR domain-containing protein [Sphingomonas sp. HDW15A]|uniref:SPOR domain-containing protein n=1 Tax=Sphingomonas sp. HDW15A TaxID=2714942 RepID=UPI001407B912|nr:SPOR domain-containing protein [Sphingomonas sp. HDW15A]QIK96585.1 SPOR domain-containing protein [Sphingomonas sp. HDW15A]
MVAKQREAARTWPKMPSPGPAGQVIQLGAFSTRARAQNAYRERLARYPVLSGMPQVIVPVITQPRGEILYVLRLGTQSREQSNVVCRNLRTSGDHCLVIG